MTKPNPQNSKNCSSKCAYDCAQLQYTIQNRTVLIISPLTSRQTSQLRCCLSEERGSMWNESQKHRMCACDNHRTCRAYTIAVILFSINTVSDWPAHSSYAYSYTSHSSVSAFAASVICGGRRHIHTQHTYFIQNNDERDEQSPTLSISAYRLYSTWCINAHYIPTTPISIKLIPRTVFRVPNRRRKFSSSGSMLKHMQWHSSNTIWLQVQTPLVRFVVNLSKFSTNRANI